MPDPEITESDLLHIKAEFRRYEHAMQDSRAKDEKRADRLDKWEQGLHGRERALQQNIDDFEHRKKQFERIKGIQ